MPISEIESLLEDWRDGKYIEVSDSLKSLSPSEVVSFCDILVRYSGQNNLNILRKFMD